MIDLPRLDREIIRRKGLYEFVRRAWHVINPQAMVDNWHIEALCKYLESITYRVVQKGVINVPPSTGKTQITEIFWPAWVWGIVDPSHSWIFASYTSDIPTEAGEKLIELLRSDWYISRFGQVVRDGRTKLANSDFRTLKGGRRLSTSVRGTLTGFHANTIVVDDPMKAQDAAGGIAFDRAELETVNKWYRHAVTTRTIDPASTAFVIIMQRLHENDLAGFLLASGDYDHFCLPMRYVSNTSKATCCPRCRSVGRRPYDRRTRDGELLFPHRWPEHVVKFEEVRGMGPDVAAAQFQQDPQRAGGTIFREDWLQYWTIETLPEPNVGTLIVSVDATFKGTDTSDFVAIGVWVYHEDKFYLLQYWNERLDFVETLELLRDIERDYPEASRFVVEAKANGDAIESSLKTEFPGLIELVEPRGGKVPRARATTKHFQRCAVFLPPECAEPTNELRKQLLAFPRARFDDLVDEATQAITYLDDGGASWYAAFQHEDFAKRRYLSP